MTIFQAAQKVREHVEEKTKNSNIVSATWGYIVDPSTGEILKCEDPTRYPSAFGFRVKYRNGNIEIEEA